MLFRFELSHSAIGNQEKAVIRESTRLACLAWCLQFLGHRVFVPEACVPRVVRESWRYKSEPFASLDKSDGQGVLVCAERQMVGQHVPELGNRVFFKTSVNTVFDKVLVGKCKAYVAHEYDADIDMHESLLPIPFMVHDRVVEHFMKNEMIQAYLKNDLELLRLAYRPKETQYETGFIGHGGYGRKGKIERFLDATQLHEHSLIHFYESQTYEANEYLRKMALCNTGLYPHGDTPKSNRFSELVMLGVPIVMVGESYPRVEPMITNDNAILLNSWGDAENFEKGLMRRDQIRENADRSYTEGWSPMGVAHQIVKRLSSERADGLQGVSQ